MQGDPKLEHTLPENALCHVWLKYDKVVFNENIYLLYPTQRVSEGIMFLTRLSVIQSVSQSCFSCQRNSSETAQ